MKTYLLLDPNAVEPQKRQLQPQPPSAPAPASGPALFIGLDVNKSRFSAVQPQFQDPEPDFEGREPEIQAWESLFEGPEALFEAWFPDFKASVGQF